MRARERRRWKAGNPTPRMLRKRAGYFAHLLRKQIEMQTGENPKYNRALDPGCGGADVDEIIMLDVIDHGQPVD